MRLGKGVHTVQLRRLERPYCQRELMSPSMTISTTRGSCTVCGFPHCIADLVRVFDADALHPERGGDAREVQRRVGKVHGDELTASGPAYQ